MELSYPPKHPHVKRGFPGKQQLPRPAIFGIMTDNLKIRTGQDKLIIKENDTYGI